MLPFHFSWILVQLFHLALLKELYPEFICIDTDCYSSSWIGKRFAKARGICNERKGELMTAQSSELQQVVAKLMGKAQNENTKVWIGMERKDGCSDLQLPLRGFTWVTGDSHADSTKWKNDGKTCGARCATVGKDGTWEETPCDSKADGFLCEINYSSSCSSLKLPFSYNVTYYHTSLGKAHPENSVFPPGTMAAISTFSNITKLSCEKRSDGTSFWRSETPGAWSCDIENGGCEYICTEESGIVECSSPPGSELKEDQNSCTKFGGTCEQICFEVTDPPGFQCMCTEGYQLAADGKSCEDIDDCAANPNICDHHCINTIGSYTCVCTPGYRLGETNCDPGETCEKHCEDIDECNEMKCEQKCVNLPGSYKCSCNEGFAIDENKVGRCQPICNTSVCPAVCDIDGCWCPTGYIRDEPKDGVTVCSDMDECLDSPCDWFCINTLGSYICTCPEGYTMQHNGDCIPPTRAPPAIPPPTIRPADLHSLQPTIMWGVCSGLLSLFIVLLVMLCHRMRRHYTYQHDLEYSYKTPEKNVELKKIMMEPQKWI